MIAPGLPPARSGLCCRPRGGRDPSSLAAVAISAVQELDRRDAKRGAARPAFHTLRFRFQCKNASPGRRQPAAGPRNSAARPAGVSCRLQGPFAKSFFSGGCHRAQEETEAQRVTGSGPESKFVEARTALVENLGGGGVPGPPAPLPRRPSPAEALAWESLGAGVRCACAAADCFPCSQPQSWHQGPVADTVRVACSQGWRLGRPRSGPRQIGCRARTRCLVCSGQSAVCVP